MASNAFGMEFQSFAEAQDHGVPFFDNSYKAANGNEGSSVSEFSSTDGGASDADSEEVAAAGVAAMPKAGEPALPAAPDNSLHAPAPPGSVLTYLRAGKGAYDIILVGQNDIILA